MSTVAREMVLSRMYVVRSIRPWALLLIAKRFLYLADQTDPVRTSRSIQGVLHQREALSLTNERNG